MTDVYTGPSCSNVLGSSLCLQLESKQDNNLIPLDIFRKAIVAESRRILETVTQIRDRSVRCWLSYVIFLAESFHLKQGTTILGIQQLLYQSMGYFPQCCQNYLEVWV